MTKFSKKQQEIIEKDISAWDRRVRHFIAENHSTIPERMTFTEFAKLQAVGIFDIVGVSVRCGGYGSDPSVNFSLASNTDLSKYNRSPELTIEGQKLMQDHEENHDQIERDIFLGDEVRALAAIEALLQY